MSDSADEHPDVQALLRGFGSTWTCALFVYSAFGDDPARNRAFLRTLPTALGADNGPTSVAELDKHHGSAALDAAFNVAFTYGGLSKLGIAQDILGTFPSEFIQGMAKRAGVNHDNGRSSPQCWEQPWRDGSVDLWIGIYAHNESVRERQRQRLLQHLAAHGMRIDGFDLPHGLTAGDTPVWLDDSGSQPEPLRSIEHFGFGDGLSNPPVKGLVRPQQSNAGGKLDAKGNWQSMAAGEFLYGYLDEIGEVPAGPTPTDIGRNGTYLVLRKLSQDVDAFRHYLRDQGRRHAIGADVLATKLIGRTRRGVPLVGRDTKDHNNFRYDEDPHGVACPLGAHLRRTNPRDSLGFQTLLVDRHRIIRRGISYGNLVPRDREMHEINPLQPGVDPGQPYPGQGLIFLALNVDIRRQFEFVQSQWVNFGNDLGQGSDRDPITGAYDPNEGIHNRIVILTDSDERLVVCPQVPSFVETRGGDYFFLPGVHAYTAIAGGHQYR